MRYQLSILVLAVTIIFAPCRTAQAAACNPSTTVCVGQTCDVIGKTTMDKDQKSIIACLYDASNKLIWKIMAGDAVPSGAVQAFLLSSCPTGWTSAAAISGRTVIGTGQGGGLTNRSLGETGGEESHTLSLAEMPSHNHGVNDPGHSHYISDDDCCTASAGWGNPDWRGGGGDYAGTTTSQTGISIQSNGGNAAHNTMMPYIALLYCYKD